MALTDPGRAALAAILAHEATFPRLKDSDFVAASTKLARKQVIAAGLTLDDLTALKTTLGADVFEKTLDSLTPHQIKLLARRLDKDAPEIEVNTGSSALSYVRQLLDGAAPVSTDTAPEPSPDPAPPKKNKYLGRKAFRTGR